jgi:hypothetical protein
MQASAPSYEASATMDFKAATLMHNYHLDRCPVSTDLNTRETTHNGQS